MIDRIDETIEMKELPTWLQELWELDRHIARRAEKHYLELQAKLKNNGALGGVSGMLPLTEYAKEKLQYINGSCIARDFPNEQPTKQWAGAVLDLLEELGLGNYR